MATTSNNEEMSEMVNILLIGDNAADKAITLNALANYLKYPSYEQALSSLDNFSSIVPVEYILPNSETRSTMKIKVEPSNQHNDSLTTGMIENTIFFANYALRIIDMPSMKNEFEQTSKIHSDAFKKCLQMCPNTNAVVFIVKGNEPLQSSLVKDCVNELMTMQNACANNVMFCFTNSGRLYFGPGDGFEELDKTLNAIQLKLESSVNSFFIDNDAYRFLIAKKQGHSIPKDNSILKEYWNHSAEQIKQMLECIVQIASSRVLMPTQNETNAQAKVNVANRSDMSDARPPNKSTFPEVNILLIGETGAGKSTTLNALANYLRYGDFDNALNSLETFTEVIPSRFTLPDVETGESTVIKTDSSADSNERHTLGNSSTLSTMSYAFKFPSYTLRIIDTPGIGDTGGTKQDKKNFENIMNYLQHHDKLNAVVFIVKGNESRKSVFFRFCITELLTYLHKNLRNNLIFCFTHSRNSLYGAGEGFQVLNGLFENELKEMNMKLIPKQNCFFIDNESYRFLVAKKCGYKFPDFQKMTCNVSWNHSSDQMKLMMELIFQLEPHSLQETITLNSARKIIQELAQPMVEMTKNICNNIKRIEEQEKQLSNTNQSKNQLEKLLRFDVEFLQLKEFGTPSVVCTSKKCIEVIESKVHYRTRCHENCFCRLLVTPNMTGQWGLIICSVMQFNVSFKLSDVAFCKHCGCNWAAHMHMDSEYEKVKRTMIDSNVQEEIVNHESMIEKIDGAKQKVQLLLKELREELKIIQKICAKFAYVYSSNAHVSQKNYFEQYLDFLIDQEDQMQNSNSEALQQMKIDHQKSVQRLTEAIANGTRPPVQIKDVLALKKSLLSLKHTGSQFENILQTKQNIQNKQFKYMDKQIDNIPEENVFSRIYKKYF